MLVEFDQLEDGRKTYINPARVVGVTDEDDCVKIRTNESGTCSYNVRGTAAEVAAKLNAAEASNA